VTDYDLFGAMTGPDTSAVDGANQYTLGTEWWVTSTVWLKGYKFWRPADGGSPAVTGPIVARTWTATGTPIAGTDAAFTLSGSGTQTVFLGTPVALSLGPTVKYRTGAHFPNGRYPFTAEFWGTGPGSAGIINGPLTGPNQSAATDGEQGSLVSGSSINFPSNGSPNASFYWVTPIVTDVDPGGESNSGDVTSALALGSSASGSKTGAGSPASALVLSSSAAGSKTTPGAVGSPLGLTSSVGTGMKLGAGAVSSILGLASSVTGSADTDGSAVRSQVLCSAWALPDDVPEPDRAKQSTAEWARLLLRASEILYYLSGRRWLGLGCTETATLRSVDGNGTWPYHPSWGSCPCWSYGTWQGQYLYPPGMNVHLGHFQGPVALQLPMSPIGAVTEVREDGVLLASFAYRVSRSGWVTRLDGRSWNTCMDTTTITYTYGEPPPGGGVDAAVELGIELAAYGRGEQCAWPRTVTSVSRQGLSMEIANPLDFIADGRTGLPGVDMWLGAVNPQARGQRGRVWSPDIPTAHL
jgi:hypothetical protein